MESHTNNNKRIREYFLVLLITKNDKTRYMIFILSIHHYRRMEEIMHRHNHNKSKNLTKANNDFNIYEDELEYLNIMGSNAACEIMKLRSMHYIQRRNILFN